MTLVVLFGPTGAGKTYIGKILEKHFGFYFYDGDADLPKAMKEALKKMHPITDSQRDRFFKRLFSSIDKLLKRHSKLVVAQTFIKEKYRRRLLKRYPQVQFILVKTKASIRYLRRQKRADYPWNQSYVKRMDLLFELPRITHQVLTNDSSGPIHLKAALQRLFLKS